MNSSIETFIFPLNLVLQVENAAENLPSTKKAFRQLKITSLLVRQKK
jgi:hypothetical protein